MAADQPLSCADTPCKRTSRRSQRRKRAPSPLGARRPLAGEPAPPTTPTPRVPKPSTKTRTGARSLRLRARRSSAGTASARSARRPRRPSGTGARTTSRSSKSSRTRSSCARAAASDGGIVSLALLFGPGRLPFGADPLPSSCTDGAQYLPYGDEIKPLPDRKKKAKAASEEGKKEVSTSPLRSPPGSSV